MPCYDARNDADYYGSINRLTSMLCGICRRATDARLTGLIVADPDLSKWWAEHVDADRRRELAERSAAATAKLREVALAKLSLDERKALGL
jgi:uncharacterized Zn finger protein